MTSLADQDLDQLGGRLSILTRQKRDHERLDRLLRRLAHSSPGVEAALQDVRDEEDELLPRLQDALDVRRLRMLGVAWEAVRRTAPTRPHPVVSRRPPGNALAALPLTLLDRGRDRLDAGGRRFPRLAPGASRASNGLAAVAGRVEQAGPLRRGEDPSTHCG